MSQEPMQEPKGWTWEQACAARDAVVEARDLLHQLCGQLMIETGVDLRGTAASEIREAIDHANCHLTQLMIVFARTPGPAAAEAEATIDAVTQEADDLDRLDPDNGP